MMYSMQSYHTYNTRISIYGQLLLRVTDFARAPHAFIRR
jgi:hypothetical protein